MKINLIYAQSLDGYIGKDGKLPWHIPEDLERFKWLTSGCPVIMGRKTWDSLPAKVRPLPGRRNIVMTSRKHAELPDSDIYCHAIDSKSHFTANTVAAALQNAEEFCKTNRCDHAWVIGGKEIYELFEPVADFIHLTIVCKIVEGDVKAPQLTSRWDLVHTQNKVSSTGIEYIDTILRRIP